MSVLSPQWKPNTTVAALVERNGRFLMVEERIAPNAPTVFNQPAGHWEYGESLLDAVIRETREETGWIVQPLSLLSIYTLPSAQGEKVYLRFNFRCCALECEPNATLDEGIVAAHWLTPEEIRACRASHRSSVIEASLNDALSGVSYPLDILRGVR